MYTANQLYALKDYKIYDLTCCLIQHLQSDIDESSIDYDKLQEDGLIEIRILAEKDFDYRRFARLATVWFKDAPVMIIQNAGREGDDHKESFITDHIAYISMIDYIRSMYTDHFSERYVINPDEPIESLTSFYGCKFISDEQGDTK